jgi:hypothetical protein
MLSGLRHRGCLGGAKANARLTESLRSGGAGGPVVLDRLAADRFMWGAVEAGRGYRSVRSIRFRRPSRGVLS